MRKKFYMVLDTETATLPFANQIASTPKQKQTIAIAKPLVYDIGWIIMDRQGTVYKKVNYLVQETFFVPMIFNTAYYKDKRPIYIDLLNKREILADTWNNIIENLLTDLKNCDMVTAYNACFDFKKAIPFTEKYIRHLYSFDYNIWEQKQKERCIELIQGDKESNNPDFLTPIFNLRGCECPIVDLWGLACEKLINIDKYRNYCLENSLLTASAIYFKTSAETSFQYLMRDHDFIEDHTALSDAEIEGQILAKALKKGKVEPLIKAFPFRKLGTTYDYAKKKKKYAKIVIEALNDYIDTLDPSTAYCKRMETVLDDLISNTY